jgi:hypothetical protein
LGCVISTSHNNIAEIPGTVVLCRWLPLIAIRVENSTYFIANFRTAHESPEHRDKNYCSNTNGEVVFRFGNGNLLKQWCVWSQRGQDKQVRYCTDCARTHGAQGE